jgi:predicted hotdog family 3-hydroxylacyl-ACP dehydratase
MALMKRCTYPVAALLPHEAPMILLDDVIEYNATALRARVEISSSSPFVTPEGVPAHVGLEYMAQACGAHAGAMARDAGAPVRVGFLLGTRQYRMHRPWFRIGERLNVSVNMTYSDNEMGSFSCRIEIAGDIVAEAQLNVIQPRTDHPMLQRGKSDG